MLQYLHSLTLFCITFCLQAQNMADIKQNPDYLWGEGTGTTVNSADREALEQLSGQISVNVESKFTLLKTEDGKGANSKFAEECKQIINTYSAATLTNTQRLVLGEEPNAHVFRYIKRAEIDKIFAQRKQKIIDFTATADKAFADNRIAVALKYYYWALTLLRSHPDGAAIDYTTATNAKPLLVSYLPLQINTILGGLRFQVREIKDEPGLRSVDILVHHNNAPVQDFCYSYWTGSDWSTPVDAKDGFGFMTFYGDDAKTKAETRIKAEYIFEGEARVDRELEEVIKKLNTVAFRSAYFNLSFTQTASAPTVQVQKSNAVNTNSLAAITVSRVQNPATYYQKVNQVVDCIKAKQYDNASTLFTPEGFDVFNRLVKYGQARVIMNDSTAPVKLGQTVICRGPKLAFSFANSTKNFVEDLVFHFNTEGKIETLSFGLNQKAVESILNRTIWSETERLTLIDFLEHYKTAYALKRLDYIKAIFADDALIITGSMLKVKPNIENNFANNTIVKYNRYSKAEYIKKMEMTFAGNEFINIEFEESAFRKSGKKENTYGIQIKQNYTSANYADQGYLFLLLDFENPAEPLIHVRTWQPEKNSDGSVYGITDF